MLFVSTSGSETTNIAAGKMWRCSLCLCHSKKKVVVWILSAFSRICHRLNVCLLTQLGCLTLIHENDSCLSQSTAQCSATSVCCTSSAEPSNGKGSSAKTGMHLKGCVSKVQCILIWLGACQSYKLVGILITAYFFYWFPLHAYLRYACSSLFGFPHPSFLFFPFYFRMLWT